MGRVRDLTGQVFGGLVAERRVGSNEIGRLWKCRCSCGNEVEVLACYLTANRVKSCGCRRVKHGEARKKERSVEFTAWSWLKQTNGLPKEWEDFNAFLNDVGRRPGKHYKLSKHQSNQPHSKENTYWRSAKDEQNLTANDLGDEFVVDLRAFALAEAAARAGRGTTECVSWAS